MSENKTKNSDTVAITKLLVARREFWIAVIVLIVACVVLTLAVVAYYPELLSEIVDLFDEDAEVTATAPRLMEPYEWDSTYPPAWLFVTPSPAATVTP